MNATRYWTTLATGTLIGIATARIASEVSGWALAFDAVVIAIILWAPDYNAEVEQRKKP